MRGKRAKAMRRANTRPGGSDERQRLLGSAALILVEPLLAKARTGEMRISKKSHDLATSLVGKAAAISGGFDDAWAQAQLMAEDGAPSVIAQIPDHTLGQSFSLRDESTWPKELANKPLHPLPRPVERQAETAADGGSRVRMRAVHQIAHGITAVWMTSESASVGFAAYSIPKTIGDQAVGVVAAAGYASEDEFQFGSRAALGGVCECGRIALLAAVSELGIAPSFHDETARQWLERIGRWEDVRDVCDRNYDVARLLIARARNHGYFDRLVKDMSEAGRIELTPDDVPLVGEKDVFGPLLAADHRSRAFAAAAGYAAEAETCRAPILVASGYWGCEWYSDAHEGSAAIAGHAPYLAMKALNEPGMLSPESRMRLPTEASDKQVDAVGQALDIVKRHWDRIESIAEAVMRSGWVIVVDGRPVGPEVSSQNTQISKPMLHNLLSKSDGGAATEADARVAKAH